MTELIGRRLALIVAIAALLVGCGSDSNLAGSATRTQRDRYSSSNQSDTVIVTQKITLAKYNSIQTGMTYGEVTRILGKSGTELSSNDIAGIKTVMYMWENSNPSEGNMNAMFQDGKLIAKAQFGLR